MKKSVRILALVMAALMLTVSLASCFGGSKADAIKKAFEKEDWEVTTIGSDDTLVKAMISAMPEEQQEKMEKYELIWVQKGLETALIIKCSSAKDLKDFLTVEDKDGKKDDSAYEEAEEEGYINGDCFIIPITSTKAQEIFAGA